MSRVCEICGKGTSFGKKYARRGLAKYLGGVGKKITGKTHRTFKSNIQGVKVLMEGTATRMRVCTKCLRSQRITKR